MKWMIQIAPTGPAYRAMAAMQQQQQQQQQQQNIQQQQKQQRQQHQQDAEVFRLDRLRQQVDNDLNIHSDNDNDDDEYDDDLLLSDPALDALRERRLHELQMEHAQKQADLARGHGQYRTIGQDEFLPETCTHTTSEFVAVHFFEESFQKCKVLDHHLSSIATRHLTCKFLRIAAGKAPFFCTKLQIRTLPTVIVFSNGKVVDRLTGFEGIQPDQPPSRQQQYTTTTLGGSFSKRQHNDAQDNPDELDVNKLLAWLGKTGAIEYKKPLPLRSNETKTTGVYRSRLTSEYNDDN
jgi:thiol-disulfide isomerase/thioredoxin